MQGDSHSFSIDLSKMLQAAVTFWVLKKNFLREWDSLRPDMLLLWERERERERPRRKSLKLNGHKRNARLRPERAVHCSSTTTVLPAGVVLQSETRQGRTTFTGGRVQLTSHTKNRDLFWPGFNLLEGRTTTKCLQNKVTKKKKKYLHIKVLSGHSTPLFRWICF
jgi:hypothetical protein